MGKKMTESKECISQHISELHDEHPEMEDKQIVAIAYKKCGLAKEDFEDGFCPYKTLGKIRFIQNLEKAIYSNDFSDIPTSTQITKAVNDNLPKLRSDFPNRDELDVLKMAYDMARGVLDNSDFEIIEEEAIYFEIYVDDPIAFEAELQRQYLSQFDDDFGKEIENPEDSIDFTDDKANFFAKDKPVSGSSNVAEIGYERGKLRIFFKNGGGYEYPVPSSWYMEMLNAPSKGAYVWETLRGKTPGRVIDNPNKITPGGVGGSIVPYFKIKGAAMDPDTMRKSVSGFLKAARRGKAEIGGVPIRRIPKPEFKAFKRFLRKGVQRFTPEKIQKPSKPKRSFKRIAKKAGKKVGKGKGKIKDKEEPTEKEDKSAVREQIKRIRKALQNARKAKLDPVVIKALENRIKTLERSISDFTNEITFYNVVDDFSDDMRYFSGPITRAGKFEYHEGTKYKTIDNLNEVFGEISHLPSFDSHNENQILGFGYNFTDDPDKYLKNHPDYEKFKVTPYIFSEGYTFSDVEEIADISLDSDTKLPVSIRFLDANEGTENPEQYITDAIHLAISVNQTDLDRCSSSGGNPCYVQFQDKQDFIEKLEQNPVGDFMPENEKKKEKKPPKDKDEEEEDKEDKKKKKESSDQTKSDPPMDAEFLTENKRAGESKDFKEPKDDMVLINKSVIEDLSKQVSDMANERAQEKKQAEKVELTNIVNDFNDMNQTYKIKSDFTKSADLETMRVLKTALVKHTENVDAQSQIFTKDFDARANELQKRLETQYNVPGAKK